MHVALNALLLSSRDSYRGAGVSTYSQQLLSALSQTLSERVEGDVRLSAFVGERNLQIPGIALQPVLFAGRHPVARIVWEQSVLPMSLRRMKPDLHHGLVNVLPLAASIPTVVTVHDLSFERMPEVLPPMKRRYLHHLCGASCRQAQQIIAVSRQTADDVVALYSIPPARVTVVHNGVDSRFRPGSSEEAAAFRRRRSLPPRYLLYLGTLEPRKNLVLLVYAFARWKAVAGRNSDLTLIIAGAKGWFYDEIFRAVQDLDVEAWVRFPGYIPPDELPDWYRAATAFVYPSRLEGFGLPVLEAMACGTPVLCSRIPSLVDVAGDAALTFEPSGEGELAGLLDEIDGSPALRAELRRKGLQRAAGFTWARSAAETMAVYHAALRT